MNTKPTTHEKALQIKRLGYLRAEPQEIGGEYRRRDLHVMDASKML